MANYYHYCYLITNTTNGMKYFGVRTSEVKPEEDKKYMGSGTRITAVMKQLGKDKFTKDVLMVFNDRDDAMEYEEDYMAENDCVDSPDYYNLSAKSTGGRFDYHDDLKAGLTSAPQEKNGAQKMTTKSEELRAKSSEDIAGSGEQTGKNQDGKPDGRVAHNGQMGGARPGAGRPKGSKSIFSKKSVEKLMELDIDPMEELVRTYYQVCEDIENTRSISARTSLYNTRQKIMSELMRYGYRPVPQKEEKSIELEQKGPMAIVLTDMEETKED
jgi:hypothetical protein